MMLKKTRIVQTIEESLSDFSKIGKNHLANKINFSSSPQKPAKSQKICFWLSSSLPLRMKMILLLVLFSPSLSYISVPIKVPPATSSTSPSIPKSLSLSASIKNHYNFQYSAFLQIGTPPQSMSFVLDTGSSWTWVPGTNCDCHESPRFDSASSSTYKRISTYDTLYYGEGVVDGILSKETITVDGLTAKGQYFLLTYKDSDLDGLQSSGLCGLGFSQLAEDYPTLIDTLKAQGVISRRVFSFYLTDYDGPYAEDATLTIGGYDSKLYGEGDPQTIEISDPTGIGFWMFELEKIQVGSKYIESRTIAILDTGTSYILGPRDEIAAIREEISKVVDCQNLDGYFMCECKFQEYKNYPSITFTIDGQDFTLLPQNYLFYYDEMCLVTLVESVDSAWLIGQGFFRQFYTVHDMDSKQIQIWRAKGMPDEPRYSLVIIVAVIGGALAFILVIISTCLCMKRKNPVDYRSLPDS